MPIATSPIQSSSPPQLPTPKRPQSILRGSSTESYHKKRLSSSLEPDSQTSSGSKRQKVSFTPRPTIHILCDETEEKSATLVAAEIRNALLKRGEGAHSEDFEELQQAFTTPEDDEDAPSDGYLCKCLLGLASNSHLIKRNCASLVHAILGMKWLHRDDEFVSKYQRFLNQLVVGQSGFITGVLKMLVDNFAHLSTSSSGVRRTPGLTRRSLHERIQSCIRQILAAVPSASSVLCTILTVKFPYITDTRRAHTEYVQNLLQLSSSNPELFSHILDLTLDRLMAIDLQIQEDVSDIEEDVSEILVQPDALDDEISSESSTESEPEIPNSRALKLKEVRILVGKMDGIIHELFTHLEPLLVKASPQTSQQTFNHLLGHLRNTLLRTPSCRHVQFLLFWAAQTNPDYAYQLLDTTLDIATDSTRPAVLRVAAFVYTASFTARAAKLPSEIILYALHTIAIFLNNYRKVYETSQSRPDPIKHAPYYFAVQTCIYLFCFRWRDLVDSVEPDDTDDDLLDAASRQEVKWDGTFKDALTVAVSGTLNPLRLCNKIVLDEFADVSYRLGFVYVYSIIERNRRVRLQQIGTMGGRETSLTGLSDAQQLDGWFPFDPYCLPMSKAWIDPVYRDYVSPGGDRKVMDDGPESDDDVMSMKDDSLSEVEDSDVGTPEDN